MGRGHAMVLLLVAGASVAAGATGAARAPANGASLSQVSTAPKPKVDTGADDCTGATVFATYSPKLEFGLEGQQFALPMFAAEAIRRNAGKPMRCVIVTASCRDAALSKQALQLFKPYGVTRISWQPDRKLFPKSTSKFPECKA